MPILMTDLTKFITYKRVILGKTNLKGLSHEFSLRLKTVNIYFWRLPSELGIKNVGEHTVWCALHKVGHKVNVFVFQQHLIIVLWRRSL